MLSSYGLTVNQGKCLFSQSKLQFLGHLLTPTGVEPLPAHVDAVRQVPVPADKLALPHFLGMINFSFIPGLANII